MITNILLFLSALLIFVFLFSPFLIFLDGLRFGFMTQCSGEEWVKKFLRVMLPLIMTISILFGLIQSFPNGFPWSFTVWPMMMSFLIVVPILLMFGLTGSGIGVLLRLILKRPKKK